MRFAIFALLGGLLAGVANAHPPVDDPYYEATGSWGQDYDDQWAIKRIGVEDALHDGGPASHRPVVAVIDTGLDWNHADFSWDSLWTNPGETPDNGIDDDGNGYVDDMIGWNFVDGDSKPWDHDGHGTFVTGVIAATSGNGTGLAGMDSSAQIMVLKALNTFGNTRASLVAEAIVYACDNGADIINLSVGGERQTEVERRAMQYAAEKGVLVIIAAGNEGRPLSEWSYSDADNALIVAATGFDDKRTIFSNWGPQVDIAAPGLDVLSLRARYTDTMRGIPGVDYAPGAAYVGQDKRYYRASGTSFAAPIVTGAASLLLSRRPELSPEDARRVLLQSARDVGAAGVDQYTGYGLVDLKAAFATAPSFFVEAFLTHVEVIQGANGPVVRVFGTARASSLKSVQVQLGKGEAPTSWTSPVAATDEAVSDGALADIPASAFAGATVWTIRIVVEHTNGSTREARYKLELG